MTRILPLKKHRERKGLSKRRLAALCKIPYSSYIRIENSVAEARIERLRTICLVLDISLDDIFFEE